MASHRFLVQATVVGVNDGNVLYPSCIQCYAKMLHNLHTDTWHCMRCNMRCTESLLPWRYRLSLCVADMTASCNLSLFGGMLTQYFGCPAGPFHQFLQSAATCGQGIDEETILQAVQTALTGNRYIFCLRTNVLPQNSSTHPGSAHPAHSNPGCLSQLLSAMPASQRSDGKFCDFVAVQMIPVGTRAVADTPTVLDVLRSLGCEHQNSSVAESPARDTSVCQRRKKKRRVSLRKSGRRTRSLTQIFPQLDDARVSWIGTENCSHTAGDWDDGVYSTENQTALSVESSGVDSVSQTFDSSPACMLRFSCQSSMECEFPSRFSSNGSGRKVTETSRHKGKQPHTNKTRKRTKLYADDPFSAAASDVSCSQTKLDCISQNSHSLSDVSCQDSSCHRDGLHERTLPLAHNLSTCGLSDCPDDSNTATCPAGDRLNVDTTFASPCVLNKTAAEDETVLDSDNTSADVRQSAKDVSCERYLSEEGHSQPVDGHDRLQVSDGQNVSFSSSLNDSSLLLAAMHMNPHVDDDNLTQPNGQLKLESVIGDTEGSHQDDSCTQSGNLTIHMPADRHAECSERAVDGAESGMPVEVENLQNMPHSENLSVFLNGIAEDPATVDSTSLHRTRVGETSPIVCVINKAASQQIQKGAISRSHGEVPSSASHTASHRACYKASHRASYAAQQETALDREKKTEKQKESNTVLLGLQNTAKQTMHNTTRHRGHNATRQKTDVAVPSNIYHPTRKTSQLYMPQVNLQDAGQCSVQGKQETSVCGNKAERCCDPSGWFVAPVGPTAGLASSLGQLVSSTVNPGCPIGPTSQLVEDSNCTSSPSRICPAASTEGRNMLIDPANEKHLSLLKHSSRPMTVGNRSETGQRSPVENDGRAKKSSDAGNLTAATNEGHVSILSQYFPGAKRDAGMPVTDTQRRGSCVWSVEDLFNDGDISASLFDEASSLETSSCDSTPLAVQMVEESQSSYSPDKHVCVCLMDPDGYGETSKPFVCLCGGQDKNVRRSCLLEDLSNLKKQSSSISSHKDLNRFSSPKEPQKNTHRWSTPKVTLCENPLRVNSHESAHKSHTNQTPFRTRFHTGLQTSDSHKNPCGSVWHQHSYSPGSQVWLGQHKSKVGCSRRKSPLDCHRARSSLERGRDRLSARFTDDRHNAVGMPDSEDLDAFLHNLVSESTHLTHNDNSVGKKTHQTDIRSDTMQTHVESSSHASLIWGVAVSNKINLKPETPIHSNTERKITLQENSDSCDGILSSHSQTDDLLDGSAELFTQDSDDEQDNGDRACASHSLDRASLESTISGVAMSQPCLSDMLFKKNNHDSLRTIEASSSSEVGAGCSLVEESGQGHLLSSQRGDHRCHRAPPEERRVRFARKRRVSSVREMDFRLEQYTSPQQKSQCLCRLTPQQSCLKQRWTHGDVSVKTAEKTSPAKHAWRSPLVNITEETCNVNGAWRLASIQEKTCRLSTPGIDGSLLSTPRLSSSYTSILKKQSTPLVPFYQETSGSQDLFSPCSSQEPGEVIGTLIEKTPDAHVRSHAENIGKTHGSGRGTSFLHPASHSRKRLSAMNDSDVLFDDSENVSEKDIFYKLTPALYSPGQVEPSASDYAGNVSAILSVSEKDTEDITGRSVRLELSPVWSMSPDLFSP